MWQCPPVLLLLSTCLEPVVRYGITDTMQKGYDLSDACRQTGGTVMKGAIAHYNSHV
jgi:hypothetical protein